MGAGPTEDQSLFPPPSGTKFDDYFEGLGGTCYEDLLGLLIPADSESSCPPTCSRYFEGGNSFQFLKREYQLQKLSKRYVRVDDKKGVLVEESASASLPAIGFQFDQDRTQSVQKKRKREKVLVPELHGRKEVQNGNDTSLAESNDLKKGSNRADEVCGGQGLLYVLCPFCSRVNKVAAQHEGLRLFCGHCKEIFVYPATPGVPVPGQDERKLASTPSEKKVE
eukprot:CAMPEP_0113891366 /NCGR_PEP_ID=MMETSP0780_2-20120614/14714_1 /TAXON_ID=652834 /ORGANISM="Palpitomonas bilix" /LENGTH=222 /DNA_ID=CAMNT_0000880971 /DNA_START=269 /DNA_END=937 /DNA_ORIENTATION=- /assembly_acc=CAM_ASM_000599